MRHFFDDQPATGGFRRAYHRYQPTRSNDHDLCAHADRCWREVTERALLAWDRGFGRDAAALLITVTRYWAHMPVHLIPPERPGGARGVR